jgi:hypothetical protein
MSSTNKKVIAFEDYPTPRELVSSLLLAIDWDRLRSLASAEGRAPRFLEPCRGLKRNIFDLVPEDFEKYYCEIQEGLNYLDTDLSSLKFDLIITNPPFSLFEEFVIKSRSEASTHGLVCFLMRINALGTLKREKFWEENEVDKMLVCVPRPDFSGGGDDSCEYAWFCWDPNNLLGPNKPVTRLKWDKPSKRRSKVVKRKLTNEEESQAK